MKYFLFLIAAVLLSGCQSVDPKKFGMSGQDWNKLSAKAQEKLNKQYWAVKKSHILSLKTSYPTQYKNLKIKIVKGTALMWPGKKQLAYMPVELKISSGTCKTIDLFSPGKLVNTNVEVCYNGKSLSIDPSYWQSAFANGGLVIAKHHLWKQGMVYTNLSSKGYANLKNTSILVRSY